MEIPDSREQVKIWQSARPTQAPATEGLQALALTAFTAAAVYGDLMPQLQTTQKEMASQLRQQQLKQVRCLKGIYRMAMGVPLKVAAATPATQTLEGALRRNYTRSMKALRAYESRSADSEFGAVFEVLAAYEREHCKKIIEWMGMLV